MPDDSLAPDQLPAVPPAAKRRGVPWWPVVSVVLVLVIAVIWASGGFNRGGLPWRGPQLQPGEMVETRFWDLAVESASYRQVGTVVVRITATNKLPEAQRSLTSGMLLIRFADGQIVSPSSCHPLELGPSWPPLVEKAGTCDFWIEDPEDPSAVPPEPPFDIEVIVVEQEMTDDFLKGKRPQTMPKAAGWVPLTVEARDG